jgi:hypothetical protein
MDQTEVAIKETDLLQKKQLLLDLQAFNQISKL